MNGQDRHAVGDAHRTASGSFAGPVCASCRKPLARKPASRVFPQYHAVCIERAVEAARDA